MGQKTLVWGRFSANETACVSEFHQPLRGLANHADGDPLRVARGPRRRADPGPPADGGEAAEAGLDAARSEEVRLRRQLFRAEGQAEELAARAHGATGPGRMGCFLGCPNVPMSHTGAA